MLFLFNEMQISGGVSCNLADFYSCAKSRFSLHTEFPVNTDEINDLFLQTHVLYYLHLHNTFSDRDADNSSALFANLYKLNQ